MATERRRSRSRRGNSVTRPRSYSDLYKREQGTVAVTPVASEGAAVTPRTVQTIDWHAEYAHVGRDLRKLLIVSVTLVALIVVAGFFV